MTDTPEPDIARSPDEIARLLREHPETRVLDVRTASSRSAGKVIAGSELLDVNEQLAEGNFDALLEHDLPADQPLVLVCNTGGKCTRAAAFLRERGYDAVSVYGGMRGWEAAGKRVEPGTE